MADVRLYSSKSYDVAAFDAANEAHGYEPSFIENRLGPSTAELAGGAPAVCALVT